MCRHLETGLLGDYQVVTGIPHDEINALVKTDTWQLASSHFLPCEDAMSRGFRKRVFSRYQIFWHLDLTLPSLQNHVKYLCFV
jgi:hypothetical protein